MKSCKNQTVMMQQKIYGYARVSTKEQNEDRQIIALLDAGVPAKNIFTDKLSGRDFERPQYKKLMHKLDSNSIIFLKSIDRLGRNYRDLCEQWRVITKEKGADIVVLDMPALDTRQKKNLLGTFITDLILTLLSYIAESEYRTIHERQAEGIAAAKVRGIKFGRPPLELPENFSEVYRDWKDKKIGTSAAVRLLGIPTSTFRYKAKKYQEKERLRSE